MKNEVLDVGPLRHISDLQNYNVVLSYDIHYSNNSIKKQIGFSNSKHFIGSLSNSSTSFLEREAESSYPEVGRGQVGTNIVIQLESERSRITKIGLFPKAVFSSH